MKWFSFLFLLVCLSCSAFAQSYDAVRWSKPSNWTAVIQPVQVNVTVHCDGSVPPGPFSVLGGHTADIPTQTGDGYVDGCYSITKTAPLGTAQDLVIPPWTSPVVMPAQTTNTGVSQYISAHSFVATGIDGKPTWTAYGGRVVWGIEYRNSGFPGSPPASSPPNVVPIDVYVKVGPTGKSVHFDIPVLTSDGSPHKVELRYNGIPIDWDIPAGIPGTAPIPVDLTWSKDNVSSGDKWIIYVDGVPTGNSGTTFFGDGQTNLNVNINPPITFTGAPAPANPSTPTNTQSNSGNSTSNTGSSTGGTAGGSAPSTIVNNYNTTIGGGSTGATNQDIYNDVLRALIDAGNTGTASSLLGFPGTTAYTPPGETEGIPENQPDVHDLADKVSDLRDTVSNMVDDVGTKKDALNGMIPAFGAVPSQTLTLHFPVPSTLFSVGEFVLDASPYADVIANFRLVCSVSLGVLMFFACVAYFRGALADLPKF